MAQSIRWRDVQIIITDDEQPIQHTHMITIPRFQHNSTSKPQFVISEGEEFKNMNQVEDIIQWLAETDCTRSSRIAVKGGGLALDMAGFASAIYMRGVPCQYIPTTLLSMVDASVGGKTGINFGAKNLVGAIQQPKSVKISLSYLRTLSRRQFMNGMAEVIKMAFVYDSQFFRWLEEVPLEEVFMQQNLRKIVTFGVTAKIKVVEKDVHEKHERKWLNYGHTIGHAIEYLTEPQLKHGECVSIGMVMANNIAEQLNLISPQVSERLVRLLNKFQLPTKIPDSIRISPWQILQLLKKDKKRQSSEDFDFVLVKDVGQQQPAVTKVSKGLVLNQIDRDCIVKLPQGLKAAPDDFRYPASKSLSLRLLFLGALALLQNSQAPPMLIENFLTSQDTQAMKKCLINLGFNISQQEGSISVTEYIKKASGVLNVFNSGITARFIVLLCSYLGGEWTIHCSPRMTERPNGQVFDILRMGSVQLEFIGKKNCFPVKIKSHSLRLPESISIGSKQSSQFLSSILLISPLLRQNTTVIVSDVGTKQELTSSSYVKMTIAMMNRLGVDTIVSYSNQFTVTHTQSYKPPQRIRIETDLSSFSYPYTMCLLNRLPLPKLPSDSCQGDKLFYEYLKLISSKENQKAFELDFNNCTDTFMTMAVYVVAALSSDQSVTIFNIANQRLKESNRIEHTINNLKKVGARVEEAENYIKVFGGYSLENIQSDIVEFESANDHRLAMSMTVLGLTLSNRHPGFEFKITQRHCVNKTFPQFWNYVKSLGAQTYSGLAEKKQATRNKSNESRLLFLVGMRGSGKSALGKHIAGQFGYKFVDMDEVLTEKIIRQHSESGILTISSFIDRFGWQKWRGMELQFIKALTNSYHQSPTLVATGGGVVQSESMREILKKQLTIYLERDVSDLRAKPSQHRATLPAPMDVVYNMREKHYLNVSRYIISLPRNCSLEEAKTFVQFEFERIVNPEPVRLLEGYIACLNSLEEAPFLEDHDAFQIRIDSLLQQNSLKQVRSKIASFKNKTKKQIILTVRSQSQMGYVADAKYIDVHKQCRKIPYDYIDCQVSKLNSEDLEGTISLKKVLWSYHGSEPFILSRMKSISQGIKKVCLVPKIGKEMLANNLYHKNKGSFDILLMLGTHNRHTRIDNKYKMVQLTEKPTQTGIMTKTQMQLLTKLMRGFSIIKKR